jgi:paraquat-inducible protein B
MSTESSAPVAVVTRDRGSLWLWLLPVLALIATGAFAFDAWRQRGPLITIEFAHGAGVVPGDPVMLRGVRVGEVRTVHMSRDLTHVNVEARLRKDAAALAAEGTRFWIVRPEISAGRVAGLDTIFGPRYLQCDPGTGKAASRFAGLDRPPANITNGGLEIIIEAAASGSLGIDSPVVYRGVRVGTVRDIALAPDARKVELSVVIDAPYRDLVRANSRFWNAGGIGLDWGLIRGFKVQAGSLETLVAGGIAFATPTKLGEAVSPGQRFALADAPKDDWLEWSPDISIKASAR